MALTVRFWRVVKKVNSTFRPAAADGRAPIMCEANEPMSVQHPTIRLTSAIDNPSQFNYAYILEFNRYYWVMDWTFDKGIAIAALQVDPLASWKDDIGSSYQYVLRSANTSDGTIMDMIYPLTSKVSMVKHYAQFSISPDVQGCYVVGVVGGNGLTQYYYLAAHEIWDFGAAMFGDTLWANVCADDTSAQSGVPGFMKAQFNPLQYVTSCLWFPVEVPHSTIKYSVKLGYFETDFEAYIVPRNSYMLFSDTIQLSKHPQAAARGDYVNLSPFSRMKLTAFPWGEVELDTVKFHNFSEVSVTAYVDPVTGTSKLYVGGIYPNEDQVTEILTLVGNIAVPEQLSQVLSDQFGLASGAIAAVTGGIGYGAMGNIGGAIQSVVSGIASAADAFHPDVSTQGATGARILTSPVSIFILQTFQHIVDEYRADLGRPLCQRKQLAQIPGYMMIASPEITADLATKTEIDQIRSYMESGFFYE